ncbi:MAG: rhomboid family intramembrane serine protease [Acidobacteria bacterium]|nr:rhomboid family intramembrane serine protease [Acidobacteriota bacterium]
MSEPQSTNSYVGRPSMCRNCGALVGPQETACSACDAPVAASPQERAAQGASRAYDAETVRFARAVLARPAIFTFVFVAVNVFVFLLMQLSGGTENHEVLRAFGAKYNTLINAGEWWRLVTPVFIHIGWLHLVVNMYSLFMLGPYVERLYGSARFVFFWVATGIAGVAASYFASSMGGKPGVMGRFLFRGGDGPSAGASGALFGLVGVLFVFGIKYRPELPEGFKRAFGLGMLPTILINLFIGYTIPFIDNAAHLGGLAAGMLFALFLDYKRPGERGSVAFTWHALQIVSLALVVAGFGEVARHFDGQRPSLGGARQQSPATAYADAINAGQAAYHVALGEGDAKAAAADALRKIDAARGLDEQTAAMLSELRSIVERARDYAALDAQGRATTRAAMIRERLEADFKSWEARSDDWIRTEGERFGLGLDAPPRASGGKGQARQGK